MTKQIREYLEHLRLFLDGEHSREEYAQELERLKVRIGFFSHERIVHMFIMLAFAVFFLMTFLRLFPAEIPGCMCWRCFFWCFWCHISGITISLRIPCRRCTLSITR